MKNLALALIALMIAPSLAFAGGGNSKDDPTLKVINGTQFTILVILDQDFHDNGPFNGFSGNSQDDLLDWFLDAGGVVLENSGDASKFDVKAGPHTVHYLILDDFLPAELDGIDFSDFETILTFVNKGQNKKITIQTEIFQPAR